jgi:hypothetical protein
VIVGSLAPAIQVRQMKSSSKRDTKENLSIRERGVADT